MYRIIKKERGFVVEIRKTKSNLFRTKTFWTHFISVAGIESMPWHFSTKDYALDALLFKIKCDTLENSYQFKLFACVGISAGIVAILFRWSNFRPH